jgi:hypothetical protein
MITRFLNTRTLRGILLAGGLCALTVAAQAQSGTASVPFEFAANGSMMPAGEYTFYAADLSGVIVLRGAGNTIALLTTLSGSISQSTSAKLIFRRRDGMAYLSAVEWPGQSAQVVSVFKHVSKGAVAAALR